MWVRRHLELGPDQRDFPALVDFYNAGGTDYLCLGFRFGESADPSHGTGVLYSFTTDQPGGFHDAEIELLHSTLPELSLAMKLTPAMTSPPDFCGPILGTTRARAFTPARSSAELSAASTRCCGTRI